MVRKEIGDVGFSEHRMLKVKIEVGDEGKRGKGMWTLNLRLLEEEGVCEELRNLYGGWRTLCNQVGMVGDGERQD